MAEGHCKFCGEETEDIYYVFCDGKCQEHYFIAIERGYMKSEKVELPKELYQSWLEDETNRVDTLSLEQVQARIFDLEKIIFETKVRVSIANDKKMKLIGKDWANNSKAISSPDFRVNYDVDQRDRTPKVKQTKEEKAAKQTEAAGIDPVKLKELIKAKMLALAKKPMVVPTKPAAPVVEEQPTTKEPSKTALIPQLMDDEDYD